MTKKSQKPTAKSRKPTKGETVTQKLIAEYTKYRKNDKDKIYNDFNEKHVMDTFYLSIEFKNIVIRYTTIIDRDNHCIQPILIKSLRQKYKPFWDIDTKVIADKLFLPIENNMSENKNNKFDYVTEFNSNNTENYEPKITKTINSTVKTVTKCKKIKLFLTKEQKKYMKIVIGTYRYFYNRTIQMLKNIKKEENGYNSFY